MINIGWFYFSSSGNTKAIVDLLISEFNLMKKQNSDTIRIDLFNIEDFQISSYFENFFDFQVSRILSHSDLQKKVAELFSKYFQGKDFIIFSFPIFYYNPPKNFQAFFRLLKYRSTILSAIPVALITTNGGIPGNIVGRVKAIIPELKIVYDYSIHCEDNHPVVRIFPPFIYSRGKPGKKQFQKLKKSFFSFILQYFNGKEKDEINKREKTRFFFPFCTSIKSLYEKRKSFYPLTKKSITKDKCIFCRSCMQYCSADVLKINAEKELIIDYDHCIGCYRCVNICPAGALNDKFTKYGKTYTRFLRKIIG